MSDDPIWSVELTGHRFDLEDLPLFLAGGMVRVVPQDDGWRLISDRFEHLRDPSDVRSVAEELVRLINGLGRLLEPSFHPVGLGTVFRRPVDGQPGLIAQMVGVAQSRGKAKALLIKKGGIPQPDQREGLMGQLISVAESDEIAERVLHFLGRPELTWSDLYRAYEAIQSTGADKARELAGVAESAIARFQRTANSFAAVGLDARHGVDRYVPPPTPMSFGEARDLVTRVAVAWLKARSASSTAVNSRGDS